MAVGQSVQVVGMPCHIGTGTVIDAGLDRRIIEVGNTFVFQKKYGSKYWDTYCTANKRAIVMTKETKDASSTNERTV